MMAWDWLAEFIFTLMSRSFSYKTSLLKGSWALSVFSDIVLLDMRDRFIKKKDKIQIKLYFFLW